MREDQVVDGLAALGNGTRMRLFRLLVRAGEDGLNVGTLKRRLEIPASTLTHHLATLTRAGLVIQERQGREVISSADYDAIDGLVAYLTEECCTGVPAEDESNAA
jgi:DNA-binding transcriptional ArsR family regulator